MSFPPVALILLRASPIRRRILLAFVAVALSLPLLYVASHRLADIYEAPSTCQAGDALGGLLQWPIVSSFTAQLTA